MLDLSKIRFPIFPLPINSEPTREGGKIYYPSDSDSYAELILDNTDVPGKSLGERRLRISLDPFKGTKLYKLKLPTYNYIDLLRNSRNTLHFIDSNGIVFKYKKTKFYKVRYLKILKYTELDGAAYSITVEGLPCKFRVNKLPSIDVAYAGILFIGKALVLYDLSQQQLPECRRKV